MAQRSITGASKAKHSRVLGISTTQHADRSPVRHRVVPEVHTSYAGQFPTPASDRHIMLAGLAVICQQRLVVGS